MELKEAYKMMQEASGIEVGDTVKVLRKAKHCEMGWGVAWSPEMDKFIGKEVEVTGTFSSDGVGLKYNTLTYYFPFFVLEVVKKFKPKYYEFNGKKYLTSEVEKRFAELEPIGD